jgi:hypothetical protein
LRALVGAARGAGVRVRREWLGGETGGGCEIQGVRWLFLDQSLSIEEQIGQAEDALTNWQIGDGNAVGAA